MNPNSIYEQVFLAPTGLEDPYPRYEDLRAFGDLVPVGEGVRATTGYTVSVEALRHRALGIDMEQVGTSRAGSSWRDHPSLTLLESTLLAINPPAHGVLRRAVNSAFSIASVTSMRERIRATVRGLLGEMAVCDAPDFVRDFADPLPFAVVAPILGLPPSDSANVQANSLQFNLVFERGITADMLERADDAARTLTAFIDELVDFKRRQPADDLTSRLVEAAASGAIDAASITPLVFQIFNASYQTTASLLGNGLRALFEHPETWTELRKGRNAASLAVHEFLRFEPPVQCTGRHALEPLRLGGQQIDEGETVVVLIAAANRDGRRFDRPSDFSLIPRATPPLSFGWGVHKCLGARLAALEAIIALEELVDSFEAIELAGPYERWPTANMRGMASIPLSLRKRPGLR